MAYKILVCDDAAFHRLTLCHLLEKEGYEIAGQAENGEEAVALYQSLRPDLVTLDITMPVMGGLEALELIRKADKSARILMVSALGQQGQVKQALAMGAKDYVVKPYQPDRLLEAVKKALAG